MLPVKNKLGINSKLGRGEDLLKDAIDLFIPEIICMTWQQLHHPLSTFAKSQAVGSRVLKLREIMVLITGKNGRGEEIKRKTGGGRWSRGDDGA